MLTDAVGTYTITYRAPMDAAGNEAVAVIRTVTVVDTTNPVITLTGEATVMAELGVDFVDEGATALQATRCSAALMAAASQPPLNLPPTSGGIR